MEIFEQLINKGSINLIIGGTLIVLAIIAIIWMYLWFKKTKEYKRILKSIDDKVDACSKEEIERELQILSQKNAAAKAEENKPVDVEKKEEPLVEPAKEAPKAKHNFKRAMAAIETLEKDETEQAKDAQAKIQAAKAEAEKVQAEISKAARAVEQPTVKTEAIPEVEVKTVEIPKVDDADVRWDEPKAKKISQEPAVDDDDDECAVDVFAEIRKMLVETEKNPVNESPVRKEEPESGNVAKSGKEYTREELEDLIKF